MSFLSIHKYHDVHIRLQANAILLKRLHLQAMSAGTVWKWTGLGRRTRSSRWCWQKCWPKQQQQRHKQPNSSWLTSDFENKVEYVDLLTNTKLPIKIVFTHNDRWSQTKHSVAPDNALIIWPKVTHIGAVAYWPNLPFICLDQIRLL